MTDKAIAQMFKAIEEDDADLLDAILSSGDSINIDARTKQGNTALHNALSGEVATLLIDAGADITAQNRAGDTPLHCDHLSDSKVVALLREGANPFAVNKKGEMPPHFYAHKARENFNKAGSPLHYAALNGSTAFVQRVIEAGVDVNHLNSEGLTPLHLAVFAQPAIAMFLLDAGADPSITTPNGWTTLEAVVSRDPFDDEEFESAREQLAKRLIECTPDMNAPDADGNTLLHFASSNAIATLLIEAGADPFVKNALGEMPLNAAAAMAREQSELRDQAAAIRKPRSKAASDAGQTSPARKRRV